MDSKAYVGSTLVKSLPCCSAPNNLDGSIQPGMRHRRRRRGNE